MADRASGGVPDPLAAALRACTAEAGRIAAALGEVDHALGGLLEAGSGADAAPPRALQHVDLLRQEAEGLSALLGLMARALAGAAVPVRDDLAQVLRLQSQRDRLERWLAGEEPP